MTRTTFEYPDADGVALFRVVRTDNADGTKTFAQFHRENAEGPWIPRAPAGLRPVWNLAEIEWAADGSAVLVVEGEKTAIAAQALLGANIVVTTWAGGSNAVKKTDWSPLKRHRVVHWPDLDQLTFADDHAQAGQVMPFMMQPGTKAALHGATLSGGALVDIPDAFIAETVWVKDSGWDLADPIPDRYTLADVVGYIRKALANLVTPTPPQAVLQVPDTRPTQEVIAPEDEHDVQMNGHRLELRLPELMITNPNGTPKPCFENVVRMLIANLDQFKLRYDAFAHRPCYGDMPLEDEHILIISRAIQSAGIVVSTAVIGEAVIAAAQERRFHPVHDYFSGLTWDGTPRLDMWLIDHADVEDTELNRAISRKWLLQATARIFDPGCQADAMMILEGPQGWRKSTLLRTLFGDKWFSDHLPDLSNKDALLQLQGMWCIEVAELATLGRSDAAKIKQFLTSKVDRFRPPYGRIAKDFLRSCVFAGTVNPAGGYLKDPTGGRRFWPVTIGAKIDTDAVAGIRDQLWAEAYSQYRAGEVWWLYEAHLERDVAVVQDERREDDVWEDRIGNYLVGKTETSVHEIMDIALAMHTPGDWKPADTQRVGRALTSMGWHRRQRRINGTNKWLYVKSNILV